MAARVPGGVEHVHLQAAEAIPGLPVGQDYVDARDARGVRCRPDYGGIVALLQLQVAAGVVPVVVCVEDVVGTESPGNKNGTDVFSVGTTQRLMQCRCM